MCIFKEKDAIIHKQYGKGFIEAILPGNILPIVVCFYDECTFKNFSMDGFEYQSFGKTLNKIREY